MSPKKKTGDETLGRYLKELRTLHGATLREVEGATGISNVQVLFIERGECMPRLSTAARLAAFYGVGLDDLAGHLMEAG